MQDDFKSFLFWFSPNYASVFLKSRKLFQLFGGGPEHYESATARFYGGKGIGAHAYLHEWM